MLQLNLGSIEFGFLKQYIKCMQAAQMYMESIFKKNNYGNTAIGIIISLNCKFKSELRMIYIFRGVADSLKLAHNFVEDFFKLQNELLSV